MQLSKEDGAQYVSFVLNLYENTILISLKFLNVRKVFKNLQFGIPKSQNSPQAWNTKRI